MAFGCKPQTFICTLSIIFNHQEKMKLCWFTVPCRWDKFSSIHL